MFNSPKLSISGSVAVDKEGKDVPSKINLTYKIGRGEFSGNSIVTDSILVKRVSGKTTDGEFKLYVSENRGGERDGGLMGDLLDKYAKEELGQKHYPHVCYDPREDYDVYSIGYKCLLWIWNEYRKSLDKLKPTNITESQRSARSENMRKAREKRLENKKHLKTHFLDKK